MPLRWRRERLRQLRRIEKSLWRGGVPAWHARRTPPTRSCAAITSTAQFADRPDLQEAVTPTYPYWGKRVIFASTFYPALKRDNVELIPRAVTAVTETGVVDADGVEHPVDVLVLSTGFQPTNYLAHLASSGATVARCTTTGRGEPRAFLGITVPGFPNFFMIYGPGTNGGEIVWMLERQAEYAVRAVKRMMRHGCHCRRGEAPMGRRAITAGCSGRCRDTAWTVSNNYFKSEAARSSRSGPTARSSTRR